ncbi:MAG: hypothetical protein NT018_00130 [Armatimonadetes bacterium]|nr:hypothetical protein [Armatimonadota bacterium]
MTNGSTSNSEEGSMTNKYYKFSFSEDIPLERVGQIFGQAKTAIEAIHGVPAVRLNLSCKIDGMDHSMMVEGDSQIGNDLAKVLLELFTKEFDGCFDVIQVQCDRKHSDYVYHFGAIIWEP